MLEALEKRDIDVAFITHPPNINYPRINFKLIGVDEYTLVMSDKHQLARRKMIDLAELKDERFILHHPDQSITSLYLQACSEAGFTPNVVCRIESSAVTQNLVRTGLGITFLPAEELDYFQMNGIRKCQLTKPIEKRIVMATLANGKPSHLASTFLDFAQSWSQHKTE